MRFRIVLGKIITFLPYIVSKREGIASLGADEQDIKLSEEELNSNQNTNKESKKKKI